MPRMFSLECSQIYKGLQVNSKTVGLIFSEIANQAQ